MIYVHINGSHKSFKQKGTIYIHQFIQTA